MTDILVYDDTDVVISAEPAEAVQVAADFATEVIQVAEQGPPGPPGSHGTDGADGNTILYGGADPTPMQGKDGDFFINTATHFIFGPKIGGTWPPGVSLVGPQGVQGPQGPKGADGNTVLYGAGPPSNSTGLDGNFYIDTSAHFMYGPKASGAWPAGTSLIGPQGPAGPQGPVGPSGGVADAPADGTSYGRKNTNWVRVLNLADGGTLTGPLILAADPTAALGAATKQYLDNRAVRYDAAQGLSAAQQIQARQNIYVSPFDAMSNNNIALNGAMDVNQFTPGGLLNLSSGASVYAVDQWLTSFTNATAAFQAQKISPPGSPPFGLAFPACLQLKATTAMSSLGTNDIAVFYQNFEGYRIAKLGWGNASGTGVAIGFWVYATVAGTGALSISNPNGTRCYLADFTVTSPATWQWVTIIVPPETSGSWVTTNAVAWYLFLTFAAGSGVRGASGWNTGNFTGTSATTNFFTSAGNVVCITGVVILPGAEAPSVARSPLLMRPTPEELKLCQRYYWSDYNYGTALGTADSLGTNAIATGTGRLLSPGYFPVEMRVTPSITIWDPAATNVTNAVRSAGNTQIPLTTPTPNGASTKTPWRVLTVAGTPPFTVGQDYWFHLTADARL